MPYYDGSYAIAPEVYLTKNYVVNFKKDAGPWSSIADKYFCLKNYSELLNHSYFSKLIWSMYC